MNTSGMQINGINVNIVERYGNLHIQIFKRKDLLESFLMGIIKLENKTK
jgi:hypothetical protein